MTGDTVYLGGQFSTVNGEPRLGLAFDFGTGHSELFRFQAQEDSLEERIRRVGLALGLDAVGRCGHRLVDGLLVVREPDPLRRALEDQIEGLEAAIAAGDLTEVILGWGPCPVPPAPCPADIDGSGTVDVDDLTQVILGWG